MKFMKLCPKVQILLSVLGDAVYCKHNPSNNVTFFRQKNIMISGKYSPEKDGQLTNEFGALLIQA
jgi:hypothetical protein